MNLLWKSLVCSFLVSLALASMVRISQAQSRAHVASDKDYLQFETPRATFIYPAEYESLIGHLSQKSASMREYYEKEFGWKLDQKPTYILFSSQNQISNGYATVVPEVHTAFYDLGPGLVDYMSAQSWLDQLITHETAHLYQLNIKKGYGESIHNIFGSSDLNFSSFLPPFTYTQYPNFFLPTMFLEGNATYNEGRFGNGGRLYSGHARALLIQQLAANKVTPKEMFNDHLDFPYGGGKYMIGGFLFESLASDIELKKSVNYFFNAHADNGFSPLAVNSSFRKVFSQSYDLGFENLKSRWQSNVEAQLKLNSEATFTSKISAGITFENGELYFLTSDMKSLPMLHVWDSKSAQWRSESMNIPQGKVLRKDGELATVSAESVSNNEIRSGLFQTGYSLLKGTENRYYNDIEGDQAIWVNSKNSFNKNRLFSNSGFVANVNSQAIIGHDGHILYFKQDRKKRTLYRDDQPIFSYLGYYGFPVDGNSKEIYFIGPSANGSALFCYKNKTFYRVVPSERVVDAVVVSDQQAFVAEITADGYNYQFTPLLFEPSTPFTYEFPYEQKSTFDGLKDVEPLYTKDQIESKQVPYSKFSNWKFKGVDPMFFFATDGLITADLTARFSDVLQNHELRLLGRTGSFGEYGMGIQYTNSEHVIQWDLFGLYSYVANVKKSATSSNNNPDYNIIDRYDSWLAAAGITYPFYVRPQQAVAISSHFIYQDEQVHVLKSDVDQNFSFLNQLFYGYSINPPLGFEPYRNLGLELSNEYYRSAPDWQDPRNVFGAEVKVTQDLFKQTYLSASHQAAWTDGTQPFIELKASVDDHPIPAAHRITRNTDFQAGNYFDLQKTTVQLKQAIDWSLYFSMFPISIRRFALHGDYNHYIGNTSRVGSAHHLFHEVGGGFDLDLLLIHKLPFVLKWTRYRNSQTENTNQVVTVGANLQF